MTSSAIAIWIIVAVAVAGLAVWLGGVALAARKPRQDHAHGEPLRGAVQGGMHVGGGDAPAGDTLHPGAEYPGADGEPRGSGHGSGSPLNL